MICHSTSSSRQRRMVNSMAWRASPRFMPSKPGPVGQVFAHPHLGVEGDILGQIADLPTRLARLAEQIVAADGDAAGGRWQKAGDHADGGGLAGPVGAEDTDDLALGDRERDALDGRERAKISG